MEGLLFSWVYPSDGFRFILIPDGNPSHEFPVLDGNSNMNSANESIAALNQRFIFPLPFAMKIIKINLWNQGIKILVYLILPWASKKLCKFQSVLSKFL